MKSFKCMNVYFSVSSNECFVAVLCLKGNILTYGSLKDHIGVYEWVVRVVASCLT